MEQQPTREAGDAVHAVVKAVAGMVPVAGSAFQVVMETVLAPPLERRKEKWLTKLAEIVTELQARVQELTPEQLSNNEMFITAAAQATQIALRTHQDEKLQALKAAVLHSALPNAPSEDQQLMFLRFIDEFTPWHLRLLAFFDKPAIWMDAKAIVNPGWRAGGVSTVLEHCFPELRERKEFYQQLVRDIQTRGLLKQGEFLNVTMTGNGMLEARTTEFGRLFLSYINET